MRRWGSPRERSSLWEAVRRRILYRLDHPGVDAMIMRSWALVWIARISLKANTLKEACFACKRQATELERQRMAPTLAHKDGTGSALLVYGSGPV
jgi:hypothetical protein